METVLLIGIISFCWIVIYLALKEDYVNWNEFLDATKEKRNNPNRKVTLKTRKLWQK